MPQFADLSILDTRPDPDVARVFSPYSRENGRSEWRAKFEPVLIANPRIALKQWTKRSGTSTSRDVTKCVISVPKMETLGTNDAGFTPPPTVKNVGTMNIESDVPESWDEADRTQLTFYGIYALQTPAINAAFCKGERVY